MNIHLYRPLLFTAASLGIISLSPLAAESKPLDEHVLFAYKKIAPRMDGVIDGDPAWENTQIGDDFLIVAKDTTASNATEVRVIWNDETIFFGITARSSSGQAPATANSDPTRNDGVEVWLRLRPDANYWQQLIIDAGGQTATYLSIDGTPTPTALDFEAKTSTFPGGWSAEIAIPLASLGLSKPENGATCGFAVHRVDQSISPTELSSWARLDRFNQTSRFPALVFSDDWEVSPEMAYWNKNREDEKRLRRPRVSAARILAADSHSADANAAEYTLWKYDISSLTDERRKRLAGLETGGLAGDTVYWSGYKDLKDVAPAFHDVAIGLNKAMVALSKLEEQILNLQRAEFETNQTRATTHDSFPDSLKETAKELDAIYNLYGQAFDKNWNTPALVGLPDRLTKLQEQIATQVGETKSRLTTIQENLQKSAPWKPANLRFAPDDTPKDPSGTPNAIHHTLYGAYPYQKDIQLLWDHWDSVNIDWTRTLPVSDGKGDFRFPLMAKYVDFIQKTSPGMKVSYHMLFGSCYAMPFPDWLKKEAQKDPDMLLTSSDGLQVESRQVGPAGAIINDGMNINHPLIQQYAKDNITALAKQFGPITSYVVAGWEDNNILHMPGVTLGNGYRTIGYNPTGIQAFQEYLASRYANIADLNSRWMSDYKTFAAIEPPADKWLSPTMEVGGLTYEWERFSRMNHLAYSRLLKTAYQEASPETPVMIDDSHFLMDGNLYWAFKEDIADIYSFHSNPSSEDAVWALLDRLTTRFGKTMGYYENYFPMYTTRVMDDSIKSRAALREFFWSLYGRGNRYMAWWMAYNNSPTTYALAYGGGTFGLDFDQTIMRWSTSLLPVMFQRGMDIEKSLVETHPEPTRAALLQPDASVLNLSARAMRTSTGLPPISSLFLLHNEFLAPGGFPADFITEEMVLDGKASLSEFSTLIVANGYWMDPAFSLQLMKWIQDGGRLIAIGPFAMDSPWGTPLEKTQSAFLTAFDPVQRTGKDLWSVKIPKGNSDSSVIKHRTLGKGRIDYLGRSVEAFVSNDAKRQQLIDLLAEAIPRLAVAESETVRLITRVSDDGTVFVFPVNHSLNETVTTTVRLQGDFDLAQDCVIPNGLPLALRRENGESKFDIQLAPGDWTVIRLTPAEK